MTLQEPLSPTAWPRRLLEQGRTETRGGNQAILLDDPEQAWCVLQGEVELFLVSRTPDGRDGSRHHLASVGTGGMLLGIEVDEWAGFVLLAVPHVDTELIAWPLELLRTESTADDLRPALGLALEQWLHALSLGMSKWATPRPVVDIGLAVEEPFTVPAHRRCSARHDLIWVRLPATAGVFLDIQELPPSAGELIFPLSREAWLLMTTELELCGRSTDAMLRDGAAWDGLANLHQLLFETAELNLRLANVDEFNRLKARQAANDVLRDQAFDQLLSVSAPVSHLIRPSARGETDLLKAVRLIGRAVGFDVQAPTARASGDGPSLDEIARASGLRQRPLVLREGWWQQDFGAFLAFDRETAQPLAVVFNPRGQPHILDPATGKALDFRRHQSRLTLEAVELSTHLPFRAMGFRQLFGFALARGWRDGLWMLLMGSIGAVIALAIPVATAYLIDSTIPNQEIGQLIQIGLMLIIIGGMAFAVDYAGTLAFSRAESHSGRAAQTGFIDRLLRLPMTFFKGYSAGDLADRVMAMTRIQTLLSTGAVNTLLSGIFGLFGLALMFYYDAWLAFAALLLTLLYLALSALITGLRLRQEQQLARLNGRLLNLLLELILGVAKIRLAAGEERAFSRIADTFAGSRRHQLSSQRLAAWQNALNEVLIVLGLLAFVLLIGKPSETPSVIATGAFAALLLAFQQFASGLSLMVMTATELVAIQPQMKRSRPILQATPEISAAKADPGSLSGAIEVSHLVFRYTPEGPLILDDVSLEVAPGEFIALVGPSGSGKSTLLRLLLGFETPEAGGILFDGQPLDRIDATAVRRQMGVVLQQAQLMPGSLYQNIVGTSGGSLDDAWAAARQVGLADDIEAMPMGMQTLVLEGGGSLSGGQMQRLMIARAIVARPKMLLLDEATSALDNRTQGVVTESLDRLRVTRIVVAHRLSTVANADRIYVLDGGRIVERGSYRQLMQAERHFARLAARQLTD